MDMADQEENHVLIFKDSPKIVRIYDDEINHSKKFGKESLYFSI